MRVGTGGVLLPRYSPAKAAEVFSVPASVFPGRVDLGPGRRRRSRPRLSPAGAGGAGTARPGRRRPARRRRERAGPTRAAPDVAARCAMRWKTASNAFGITFDGRLSAARQ
ncbi:hypothetical protein [Streptomyces sp. CdTB01]|uniref:hypothetical protein n=1 Tax=Streptomyces sp. CdTB01 TaxID=1725411 RepID=UPI000B11198F|nr:hypothetical protein [Streptomyces sp. CdTB01]